MVQLLLAEKHGLDRTCEFNIKLVKHIGPTVQRLVETYQPTPAEELELIFHIHGRAERADGQQ